MKKALLGCLLLSFLLLGSGCGPQEKARAIKPGMTAQEVVKIMGRPSVGWGLPEKRAGRSHLLYEIGGKKYLAVEFEGDRVADPPTAIWSKNDIVE